MDYEEGLHSYNNVLYYIFTIIYYVCKCLFNYFLLH